MKLRKKRERQSSQTGDSMAGRIAIVTGAAHGIGLSTSAALSERGFRIAAVDRDAEALAVAPLPPDALRLPRDITDAPGAIVDEVLASGMPIAALVNVVGIGAR